MPESKCLFSLDVFPYWVQLFSCLLWFVHFIFSFFSDFVPLLPSWAILGHFGHFGPFMPLWSFCAILGRFWQVCLFWAFMTVLGHFACFGPFSPVSISNTDSVLKGSEQFWIGTIKLKCRIDPTGIFLTTLAVKITKNTETALLSRT